MAANSARASIIFSAVTLRATFKAKWPAVETESRCYESF
jgi:hypothetical protein